MTYLELIGLIKTNYSVCTFICFTFAFVPEYTKDLLSVFSEQTTSTTLIIWVMLDIPSQYMHYCPTTLTRNGERLENHVLCHATVFGFEQFPSKRIYISSTQKCSYCIFLKKKKTTIPWLPDDTAFISSLLRTAVE